MSEDRRARRWERHAITIPVTVSIVIDGQRANLSGQASDVSQGGLCLFATREIAVGTYIVLEFLLPYSSTTVVLKGIIRNRTGFNYGVEFINPTPLQREIIERACKVFGLLN